MIVDRLSSHLAEPTPQATPRAGALQNTRRWFFISSCFELLPCELFPFCVLPYKMPYDPFLGCSDRAVPFFLPPLEFHVPKRTEQSNPWGGENSNRDKDRGSNFNIRSARVLISCFLDDDHPSGKHALRRRRPVFFQATTRGASKSASRSD